MSANLAPIAPDEVGKRCNVCGMGIQFGERARSRCTNRRCGPCHAAYCTGGGSTSPGHGMGNPPRNLETMKEVASFRACQGALVRQAFPLTWKSEPEYASAHHPCGECSLCKGSVTS